MNEYKALLLDREKIEPTIRNYPGFTKFNGPKISGTQHGYTIKIADDKIEAILNVYYLANGKTTLDISAGKNKRLSEKIAAFISKECSINEPKVKTIYVRKITNEQFLALREFAEKNGCSIEDGSQLQYGKQYKVKSPNGDSASLNVYNNGSMQVQGPSGLAKSILIEGMATQLPFKEVIDAQLESLEVKLPVDKALDQLKHILPTSYDYLGDRLVAILCPAVSLGVIDMPLTDYSAFAFPALRGLEGYMKKVAMDFDISPEDGNIGSVFDYNSENKRHVLFPDKAVIVGNANAIKTLEDCYAFYSKNRHSLFHVDNGVETSRVIERKQIADEIVSGVFSMIEQGQIQIQSVK